MVKLSIIIPVYNTEEYWPRGLNSCLDQDLPATEYEIIVVDDGSTDGSLQLLMNYADKYPIIRVFTQTNKRQGAARNLGLRSARGEYVWFVDSDDRIEPNCLSRILQLDLGVDIFLFPGCWFEYDDKITYSSYDVPRSQNVFDNFYRVTPCGYIYRRSFLLENNLFFIEGVVYEDNEFIPKTFFKAQKISYIDIPVYYCFVRESSTTRSFTREKCLDLLCVATKICEYKQEFVSDANWMKFFNMYIKSILHTYLFYCVKFKKEKALLLLKLFLNNSILQKEMQLYASMGLLIKMFLLRTSLSSLYYLLKLESFLYR